MPIYEYQCKQCSRRFEVKRRFTDNVPAFCPNCGGEAYRCFSTVPIIFKGSGFYTTDNRQESKFEGEADKDKVLDKNED